MFDALLCYHVMLLFLKNIVFELKLYLIIRLKIIYKKCTFWFL